jgi:hypothetical protein
MKKGKAQAMLSPENYIRKKARSLPVYKCLVNLGWKNTGMAHVCVVRQHINGNLTAGFFLVDLLCMGVKDSHYVFNYPDFEFKEALENFQHDNEFIEIDYTLAHNIIYAGLEFGEENGFTPCKEFAVSKYLIEEDNNEIELIDIDCGTNGVPTVFKGYDNLTEASKAIAILDKNVGPGNYILHHVNQDGLFNEQKRHLTAKEERFAELHLKNKKRSEDESHEYFDLVTELFSQFLDQKLLETKKEEFININKYELDIFYYEGMIGAAFENEKAFIRILNKVSKLVNLAIVQSKFDKAEKMLNSLIRKYGHFPLFEKTALLLKHSNGEDKDLQKHLLAIEKYPKYPLIKFQFLNRIIEDDQLFDQYQNHLENISITDIFKDQTKVHPLEFQEYFFMRINRAKASGDLEMLDVLFDVLKNLAKDYEMFAALLMIIIYQKISFLDNKLIIYEKDNEELS